MWVSGTWHVLARSPASDDQIPCCDCISSTNQTFVSVLVSKWDGKKTHQLVKDLGENTT